MQRNKDFFARKEQLITSLSVNICHYKDKSPKGSIDAPIQDLIHLINSISDYMTTSSCSGRISIRSNASHKFQESHEETSFWWVTHHPIEDIPKTVITLVNELNYHTPSLPSSVSFKFEPAIFHIECRNDLSAQCLLQIALESGFRNSGLCLGRRHIILAIRSTPSLEAPLIHSGQWIVDGQHYLQILCSIANQKFQENTQRLERLTNAIMRQHSPLV